MLVMNPTRMFSQTPVVKLGDTFKKVASFQKRFKNIPNLIELDHLTVSGDVVFGKNVVLRGTVIVVANGEYFDSTSKEGFLFKPASFSFFLLLLFFSIRGISHCHS